MNCANHPDRERSAFCQNCGKPLCTECIHAAGSSIFCEPCFAARGAAPGYPPPGVPVYPHNPGVPGEPNPALAALLGFIPGVGAMYNEQYAKGLVHLMVFAVLISLAHDVNGIFGLFIAGWIVYQVIEAHHTARARRDGTPLPNPFGLNDLSERLGFGKSWPSGAPPAAGPYAGNPAPDPNAANPAADPNGPNPTVPPGSPYSPPYTYTYVPPVSHWGAPQDAYHYVPPIPPMTPMPPMPPYDPSLAYQRRVPAGAIWLIGLGVFFLLANSGLFHVRARLFGPFLLIAVGIWTFVRKMTFNGMGMENDGTPHYRWRFARAANGSFWILLTGIIWLLDVLGIVSWGHSWPIYLIAVGLLLVFKRAMYDGYGPAPYGSYPSAPYPTEPTAPPVTTTAIVPAHESAQESTDTQEGR